MNECAFHGGRRVDLQRTANWPKKDPRMKFNGFLCDILRLICFIYAFFVPSSALDASVSSLTCEKDNECKADMASAVKTMRAVVAEAGKLVLVNRPVPVAKEGEVLVKNTLHCYQPC